MSEISILSRTKDDIKDFFHTKFLERKERFITVAYSILQNKEDAEDALQ